MIAKVLFFGVLVLFLLTRLYKLDQIPPSLYWDEASIAYNAYSILQTGRDEWGDLLPLHFRAFGEFKLPVYIYTVAIFEKFLGLNELAVRLPAVIFSLGTIVLTYLITFKISSKKSIGFFAAFLLTVSPWFFIFSRTGYEANAGLMFYIMGIYFFSFKKGWSLVLSTITFILSIYSYNAFRILTPLTFLFVLPVLYYDSLVYHTKNVSGKKLIIIFSSIVIFSASFVPVIRFMQSSDGIGRWQTINIFNNGKSAKDISLEFSKNYLSHFNPQFLFISGDKNLRSHLGEMGQLYWMELPLLIAGLIFIASQKKLRYYLPLLLVLLAPIPAAITRESPHALRSIAAVPFVSMISAFGLFFLAERIKKRMVLNIAAAVFFLVFFFNYFYIFINNYPVISAPHWQYGYKALFDQYKFGFNSYDQVIITDSYAQPYIFALYYLKYNPEKFLAEVEYNPVDKWGFSSVASFANFNFKPINLNNLPEGKLLLFAAPTERLVNLTEKGTIKNLDGDVAFYVYVYEYNK